MKSVAAFLLIAGELDNSNYSLDNLSSAGRGAVAQWIEHSAHNQEIVTRI